MPKLKQPSSLQKKAFIALLEIVVQFCLRLSVRGSTVERFRQGISLVQETICNHIPWPYVAKFCTIFLRKFTFERYSQQYCAAALEILMDTEIYGLRFDQNMLKYLRPQDSPNRLQGIMELDLSWPFIFSVTTVSANYDLNLKDLLIIISPRQCSDQDLSVIGQNCSKLRVLKIRSSKITDEGLFALSSCSELRVVDIFRCEGVSHSGVVHLFSSHEKLEELSYGNPDKLIALGQSDGVHFLSRLRRQFLSFQRFHVCVDNVTDVLLQLVLAHFPNLTKFHLECYSAQDLSVLKSLSNLKEFSLEFNPSPSSCTVDNTNWRGLEKVFTLIGTIITSLSFDNVYHTDPASMHLIYRFCPNIEILELYHGNHELVVLPFNNLKKLCLIDSEDRQCTVFLSKISQLPKLRTLALYEFQISFETVVAMMLDNNKFPELTRLAVNRFQKFNEVMDIARINNLDFRCSRFTQ